MQFEEIIGGLSIIITICTYIPYLKDTYTGKVTPHPFSWFIWSSLVAIIYAAQIWDNAGPGSWVYGFLTLLFFAIAILSLKRGKRHITKIDTVLFGGGVLSIPIWIVTNDPTWSVILISVIFTIAMIPTFRKCYKEPYSEVIYLYAIDTLRNLMAILALTNFTVITALFPITLMINNAGLAVFLVVRRSILKQHDNDTTS